MDQGLSPVADALTQRRLSTRDKRLGQNFELPPGAETEAMSQDLTPANIQALGRALDRAKSPEERAALMEELARLKGLAQNLLGPVQPPPMLPGTIRPGPERAPYSPQEQSPGIFGGQRMYSTPQPGSM